MSKFCTKCGKELVEGTKFCTNCGAEIVNENTQPESTNQEKVANEVNQAGKSTSESTAKLQSKF